ncbi:hypothetical protein PROFUN_05478 [Planoprotostelium fungivorum]|uniref:Uncharacterized protein n=1 Tax=Planoprotostelium fungivorum TaxID=1890364 RepID=A0A2P6NQV7_9EUKA|nr:hypothetical protein PROFUN_05478 [Planoprotostelium fungivorum]
MNTRSDQLSDILWGETECINGRLNYRMNHQNQTEVFCGCESLWEGERCDIPWRADEDWLMWVSFYQAFNTISFLYLTILCLREILAVFKTLDEARMYSVAMFCLILAGIGTAFRVAAFALDPHGIRWGVRSRQVFVLLYAVPVITWIAAGYGVCLYWMEVCCYQELSKDSRFVKKLRPVLYSLITMCLVILAPITFWPATVGDPRADLLRYGTVQLFFIGFLIITIIYGCSLRSYLRDLTSETAQNMRRKITMYIILLVLSYLTILGCSVALVKYRTAHEKYAYLITHLVNRAAEVLLVANWVILFKKGPETKRGEHSSSNSILGDSLRSNSMKYPSTMEEDSLLGDDDPHDHHDRDDDTSR